MSEELPTPGLSPEAIQRAQEWLKSKSKNGGCPICGENRWRVGSHAVSLTGCDGDSVGLMLGGVVYPNVLFICDNCKYTALVNALSTGILPQKEDADG